MKYIMCVLLTLLCGCSTTKTMIDVERVPLNLSDPPAMKLNKVEFIVIHKDNSEKVFSDLEKSGIEPVIFGLTGDGYKSLSINVRDIKDYIILQKKIIQLYRNYYEEKKTD